MIRCSEQIVISLSDFWKAIKRGRWTLFIVAASFALFFFYCQVKKPIRYTSKGVFKNSSGSSKVNLPSFLRGGEFSSMMNEGEEHLSSLFKSLPILTQVVQKLHLQAALQGYERKSSLQKLRETLHAEKSHYIYRTLKRPASLILSGNVLVPDSLPFHDPSPPLLCADISYAEETYTNLALHFHDAHTFSVTGTNGKSLGEGQFVKPFTCEKGQFTLQNYGLDPQKPATLQLTLVHLEKAALGLQNGLSVNRDKENPSLFHVQYTHSNRQLATAIVNAVMSEYSSYIKNEGEKKISQQLSYLSTRQEESKAEYERNLDNHRITLEKIVGEGGFLSLENEIDFLTKSQVSYQKELNRLHSEIQRLSAILKDLPQSQTTVDVFTLEAAEKLLASYQQKSDKLDFERAQYIHCLE
ncbi:MAG: hypothetical protein K940chlam2_00743, partial [Chlamydiae bacterium]|nr:hypothetical protein [Chlamydiota bacterium]